MGGGILGIGLILGGYEGNHVVAVVDSPHHYTLLAYGVISGESRAGCVCRSGQLARLGQLPMPTTWVARSPITIMEIFSFHKARLVTVAGIHPSNFNTYELSNGLRSSKNGRHGTRWRKINDFYVESKGRGVRM